MVSARTPTTMPVIESTVWGVTSFDRGGNAGYVVHALFTTKKAAKAYRDQCNANPDYNDRPEEACDVEEFSLYTGPPQSSVYWHRGAHVYPDGFVEDWAQEHQSDGHHGTMDDADDHMEPWDGHTQGHCGWHISIFGSNREAIETAYQKQLASGQTALQRNLPVLRPDRPLQGWVLGQDA